MTNVVWIWEPLLLLLPWHLLHLLSLSRLHLRLLGRLRVRRLLCVYSQAFLPQDSQLNPESSAASWSATSSEGVSPSPLFRREQRRGAQRFVERADRESALWCPPARLQVRLHLF